MGKIAHLVRTGRQVLVTGFVHWLGLHNSLNVLQDRPIDMKTRRRLFVLHAMLGSSHAGECENAKAKIIEILYKHGYRWNDLLDLLSTMYGTDARDTTQEPSGPLLPLEHLTTALR